MHLVIALGGNALLQRGQPLEANLLQQNVVLAAQALAPLAAEHHITLVHGNGPQVGLLALQADAYKAVQPYPFDVLDAESQGMIGYLLQQALSNYLPAHSVVTLLTQVIVDAQDPAFQHPSKPIGPVYTHEQADALRQQRPSWVIKADGQYFRRVVSSPQPLHLHELRSIRALIAAGHMVIVGGGGGIPCISNDSGKLTGVEAVIDKDLTAALVAKELNADALIILTDVDAVYLNWGEAHAEPISQISIAELKGMNFPAGSMQPKITAACKFVESTGKTAMIGQLGQAVQVLAGLAGTRIGV